VSGAVRVSRREFVLGSAALGGGLWLAVALPARRTRAAGDGGILLGPVLQLGSDGSVTMRFEKCEMGQGAHTALAMLLADELAVDWAEVRVENQILEGPAREWVTGGSSTVRFEGPRVRALGAVARELLLSAGATRLGVARDELRAESGRIVHAKSGRSVSYAELADDAARLPLPDTYSLRPQAELRLVGRSVPRVDLPDKVAGTARFGIDVALDGLLSAAVRTSPVPGGRIASRDDAAARAVPGVRAIADVPGGVAVVADRYWQAARGLDALAPVFAGGDTEFSSEAYTKRLHAAIDAPAVLAAAEGDAIAVLERSERVVEARYEVPFLAHATMEPMNCTAHARSDDCELCAPTQSPSRAREAAARALGLPLEGVRVHTTCLGGGFGRRLESDVAVQAALASRAANAPVKVVWSREEDVRHDFYRPAYTALFRAALDAEGMPAAWLARVAGAWFEARDAHPWLRRAFSRAARALGAPLVPEGAPDALRWRLPEWLRVGVSGMATEGAAPPSYRLPSWRIEYANVEAPVPIGFWRSVSYSQNAFFVESFVDELAARAAIDPLTYRRRLLARDPRSLAVLDLAARAADWGGPLAAGRGRGVAFCESFGARVCQIAEVSRAEATPFRVERITCAIDCGRIVHPDGVRAQVEGSIVFGLTAALHGEVPFEAGAARPSNFHDYRLLRLDETPEIRVVLADGDAPFGGVGEPAVPPVAPAVANALVAAGGERIRRLPLLRAVS
jgi:isoquinoline 1-oxidoreductase subunit beta